MKLKTLADLKRLKVGQKIIMTANYNHCPACAAHHPNRLIGKIREINLVQSNAIRFSPIEGQAGSGSWLQFPKASEFKPTEKGFIILDDVSVYDENHAQQWDETTNKPKMQTVDFLTYELID